MDYQYDSLTAGRPARRELRELLRYKDLLRLLIAKSIKTRYKRSSLGVVWTLLNPLFNTLVLTIAFSQFFRYQIENYPVYLLSGLLAWNFFTQTTSVAMGHMVWGSHLLKRIYVPRAIFSVSVVGNGLINFLLALLPLGVIMVIMGHPLTPAILILPLTVLSATVFVLGVTLLLAAIAAFFVDAVDIYHVLISAGFFLTPIIYPIDLIPEAYKFLLWANPIYLMIESIRGPIYLGVLPETQLLLINAGVALASLVIGWLVFTAKADELAYRV